MAVNLELFKRVYKQGCSIIDNSREKNIKNKKKKLKMFYDKIIYENNYEIQEFYAIMHELKVYDYINNQLNINIKVADDNFKGPDFEIDYAYIECIHMTKGSDTNRSKGITTRITSSLNSKKKKFDEYNDILDSKPKIIALSPGLLASEINSNRILEIVQKVLYGIGNKQLDVKFENGNPKIKNKNNYSYISEVKKYNNSKINLDIFSLEEYFNISGVIFTNISFGEELKKENFILFLNPNAKYYIDREIGKKIKLFGLIKEDEKYKYYDYIKIY